jgi:branched-chain amino acid transport system substrate-binding protein
MKLRTLGVFVAIAGLAFSACTNNTPGSSSGTGTKGTYDVGIDLPLQGSELAGSQPVINGAKLALKQANGTAGGYTIEVPQSLILDDALNGAHDPQTGANNVQNFIGNTKVIAMLGPLNSNVAKAQIPLTNEAGLAQCSPANTNEGLTKPEFGALDVRKKKPTEINYVRVATTDDLQSKADADYLAKIGVKNLYIIDDTETFGKGIADNVSKYWTDTLKLTVVGHDSVPKTTTDYQSIMTTAASKHPDGIYFGGVTATGGARIFRAAVQAGLGNIPYLGPDGIQDGGSDTKDSFLSIVLPDLANAKGVFATLAGKASYPGSEQFLKDYKAEYGIDATGYAIQGFACMQVILDAIGRAAATNPADDAAVRAAVRKTISDTSYTYKIALGDVNFDANGDTSQKINTVYKATLDSSGKASWVAAEEMLAK